MFLIIVIVIVVICVISSNNAKENRNAKKTEIKERMMKDNFILSYALAIVESVTDLKNASVQVLRSDGKFYLVFEGGSVYYETRWNEYSEGNTSERKNTQCILNRIAEGKNPLSILEDEVFAEIIKESLDRVEWMSVTHYGREICVRKAPGKVIPEAM